METEDRNNLKDYLPSDISNTSATTICASAASGHCNAASFPSFMDSSLTFYLVLGALLVGFIVLGMLKGQFSIREGFDAVPFPGFKLCGGSVKFLFFKGGGFKGLFLKLGHVAVVPESFKGAPFLGDHLGVAFLVRLLAEAAGEFRLQGIHQLRVRFCRVRALFGLKAGGHRTFGGAGAEPCGGDQENVLYPEHAHGSLYSRLPRKLQTKRRLHR